MQSTGGGGNGLNRLQSSGGGGGGLTRYRSAPATWLDALLEGDDENDSVLLDSSILSSSSVAAAAVAASISSKQSSLLPPPSSTVAASSVNVSPSTTQVCSVSSRFGSDLELLDSLGTDNGGLSGLLRQNSSPAEFLSDGYFSSSGFGVSGNYEYIMSSASLSLDGSEPPAKRPREANSDRFLARANSTPAVKIEQHGGQLHGVLFDGELAEIEKLSEDAVLCKVRAKRGCATHPRSIAERVRRTRISDRIRKLQELVPNMDKQTNTADMLDEAVEYVAFLQKQIQELTEQQKKCKCFTKD